MARYAYNSVYVQLRKQTDSKLKVCLRYQVAAAGSTDLVFLYQSIGCQVEDRDDQ